MTWSYPVYGPARAVTRMVGCTCGAQVRAEEQAGDGTLSVAGAAQIKAFREKHESCRDAAKEAP